MSIVTIEPLKEFGFAPSSLRNHRVESSQLIQYSRGKSGIDKIVGVMGYNLWPLDAVQIRPSFEAANLSVKLDIERLGPSLKFLGDELF